MTLTELIQYVRDLTGIYSADVVSDGLISRWINEAYGEVARDRDWDWLEQTFVGAVPAPVDGVQSVELEDGSRRVLSAYLVGENGEVKEMVQVPDLNSVEPRSNEVKYDVDFAGVFTFAPEQVTTKTLKIRYTAVNVELEEGADEPAFDVQFHPMLAYRAAVKVLSFTSDDTKRSEFYYSEFSSMLQGMYTMYELDHDYRTFQLGQDGLETRKYFPWFRPA
jgi:hypothetical protein